MVTVEFSESTYTLTYDEGTVLAQNLRNYAKGTFRPM
jgi:hypothetical protein